MVESNEIFEVRKLVSEEMTIIMFTKKVNSGIMPSELIPVQTVPVHKLYFFGNGWNGVMLLEKCWLAALSKCSEQCCGRLYGMDVKTLLALHTSYQKMTPKRSTISHVDYVLGLFTAKKNSKQEGSTLPLWVARPSRPKLEAV